MGANSLPSLVYLAPLAGRGRRALARRVRGYRTHDNRLRGEMPLIPTFSPQERGEGEEEETYGMLSSCRPTTIQCTSSGPSAKRRCRTSWYISPSGLQCEMPVAPCI